MNNKLTIKLFFIEVQAILSQKTKSLFIHKFYVNNGRTKDNTGHNLPF